MTDVRFTPTQALLAIEVGIQRHLWQLRSGRSNAVGKPEDDDWTVDIEGAAGEMAVAQLLGAYWDGDVDRGAHGNDVGNYQVRTAIGPHDRPASLIVRPGDPLDAIFILAVGRLPNFRVHGWICASDAHRPEWSRAPNGRPAAWFVPVEALHPLRELETVDVPF